MKGGTGRYQELVRARRRSALCAITAPECRDGSYPKEHGTIARHAPTGARGHAEGAANPDAAEATDAQCGGGCCGAWAQPSTTISRILEITGGAYSCLRADRNSRTNPSGASRSGRATGSKPSALSFASFSPGTAFFSCLRRLLKQAVTKDRNAATSSGLTSGSVKGVRRINALLTFGGGRNAPGATVNSFSTLATACTPTDNAP